MKKFYFTYGTEGYPFVGGWTEIEAPDIGVACGTFRAVHPGKNDGLLNCCSVYTEEDFSKTIMAIIGNFGKRCWKRITYKTEVIG